MTQLSSISQVINEEKWLFLVMTKLQIFIRYNSVNSDILCVATLFNIKLSVFGYELF